MRHAWSFIWSVFPACAGMNRVRQLDDASMAAMADLIAPVRALVFGAKSLEALQDGIIELYAKRDPVELGVVLEQALLAAELAGRFEAAADD